MYTPSNFNVVTVSTIPLSVTGGGGSFDIRLMNIFFVNTNISISSLYRRRIYVSYKLGAVYQLVWQMSVVPDMSPEAHQLQFAASETWCRQYLAADADDDNDWFIQYGFKDDLGLDWDQACATSHGRLCTREVKIGARRLMRYYMTKIHFF